MGIFFSRSETSEDKDINSMQRSFTRFYVKQAVGRNHWFNWFVGKTRTLLRKRNRTRRLY